MYEYGFDEEYKKLIGLRIKSIIHDEYEIKIYGEEKSFALSTYSECCSTSWIEHIELPSPGEIIEDFQQIEIPRSIESRLYKIFKASEDGGVIDEHGKEHEDLKLYFYRLRTDKGRYDIEMRNSSNGYYGGYLNLTEIE